MSVRLRLRPTLPSDLGFVLAAQQTAAEELAAGLWERPQHEAALRLSDFRHLLAEGGPGLEPVGYALLAGCRNPHGAVGLRQLVVQPRSRGFGRAALRGLKKLVFGELRAHRFWLELPGQATRAQALFEQEGFAAEGRLREAVRSARAGGGFEDLLVMSILQPEFAARHARGLELI